MSVPEDIRAVPRPKNTIVDDSGREGPNRYAVRQRSSIKYVAGGNPQPHNGKVIGHIINHEFVPVNDTKEQKQFVEPNTLSYGSSALVKSVTSDLFHDLLKVYDPADVYAMMAIATLKVIKPSITASRMSTHYKRTFVCKDYPGAALSKNSIGSLYQRIGMDGKKRQKFYQMRLEQVIEDHHIAIDGTLKQDTSIVNDLSAYSRKARVRGCREVSVLYAYDIEKMEPLCAEVFPGNCIDASAYPAFIRDNDIKKGIIVADKGFPPSKISEELKQRPNLHFITPIKRNDKRITDNDMLSFEGVLQGIEGHILYKKKQIKGGRFLYAYKDTRTAAKEEYGYLENVDKDKKFSIEKYAGKRNVFGVIILESDQDMTPEVAYQCYDDRWLLELVFNKYKSDECLDHTDVQGDFSVIGSEFVNFLSIVATCRIIRKATKLGLLDNMSYAELMDDLSTAWRSVDAPPKAVTNDKYWVHTLNIVFEELEILGLSTPTQSLKINSKINTKQQDQVILKPKRPRGRPKKNISQSDGI